ncbi:N-6 DNA methylase [Thiocapsa bogorovii]|uniref:N-6 DNA methylase n=1 Tax=Thiocapsa bogorovii TaxID=521689 RepID=UPI001E45D30F|nr:N-6 DNA methylase [Thiocapsa bogorovii]UHD16821.1 SAM-dependent methyltransferase [Thiocapsa bogorovii]
MGTSLRRYFSGLDHSRQGLTALFRLIGLPANLFYGTGIPAVIVVIDKRDSQARRGIFMLDASTGFMKDGPKNRLRAQDIHKIVDIFNRRIEVPRYARLVGLDEIEKNDFNLNLPRYIDSQTPEDVQDIAAHLQGGIPVADVDALAAYWTVCPGLRDTLFSPNRPGYLDLAPAITADKTAIRTLIYAHPEFSAFIAGMDAHFSAWRGPSAAKLKALEPSCHPKQIIGWLSEGLLAHYRDQPLVDPYDSARHGERSEAERPPVGVGACVPPQWRSGRGREAAKAVCKAHPTRRRAIRRRAVRSPTAPLGRTSWRSAARSGANRGQNRSSPRSESVRRQEPPDGFTSDTRLSGSISTCSITGTRPYRTTVT